LISNQTQSAQTASLVCAIAGNVRQPVSRGSVGIYDYGKRVSIGVIVEFSQNGRQNAKKLRPSAGAKRRSNVLSLSSKDAVN